jgi:hypothetical protein
VLREATSRGLCGLVCPTRTSERGREGACVKEGGGEERERERERAHPGRLSDDDSLMVSRLCACREERRIGGGGKPRQRDLVVEAQLPVGIHAEGEEVGW